MYDKYLVTGATGFLGRAVVEALVRRGTRVHALVLHDDPYINLLPKEVHTVVGDVCVKNSLADFFADAGSRTCVIHCAGIVSVASKPGSRLYQVNVGGTWRVLRQCMEHDVGKMVYVSSVHAIPEKPEGCVITESCDFSPGLVDGDYAKSKAMATALVLQAAKEGLNASVVFPSGIIGPGDLGKGSITNMLLSFLAGKLPLAAKGTAFQQAVWAQLRKIPYGEVRTYGQLAAALGKPKASRAVGSACHDRKSTRLNSSHRSLSRMPSSA